MGTAHRRARLTRPQALLGLIVLLAFGLRLIRPDFLNLSSDEAFFVQIAHQGNYLQAMRYSEPHPPLYLAMLQGWMLAAGVTEYGIRFLTIMQGVLLVAVVYRLGRLLSGHALGLAAAFVAAANPYQILYSQTARDYELACLFGALSFVVFLKALRRPQLVPFYVLTALLAMYSHYYAIGIVAFEQLLLAIWLVQGQGSTVRAQASRTSDSQLETTVPEFRSPHRQLQTLAPGRWTLDWRDATLRPWLLADAVMVVAYAPWLAYVSHTIATYNPGHGTPSIVWNAFRDTFHLYSFGAAYDPGTVFWPSLAVGAMFLLGLAGLGYCTGRRALTLSLGYQLAPILFGIASFVHTDQYGARFIFIGSPGYFLILGGAVVLLGRLWRPAAILPLALVGYLSAGSIQNSVLTNKFVTMGYRDLAAYLGDHIRPRDTVVLDGVSQWYLYWYYAELRNGVHQPVQFMPKDSSGQGANATPVDVEQTERALKDLASRSSGIWFIDSDALRYDPRLDTERLLATNWFESYAHNFVFQRLEYFGLDAAGPLQPRGAHLNGLDLVQATAPDKPAAAGQPVGADFVWQATSDPPPTFKDSLRLLDGSGSVVAQQDGAPDGGFPPAWRKGGLLTDHRGLVVPVGLMPGDYRLQEVAYDPSNGRALGPPVDLGQLTVDHSQPQRAVASNLSSVYAEIGGERLEAAGVSDGAVTAGGRLTATLLWVGHRTSEPAVAPLTLGTFRLPHSIGGRQYPTTRWQASDVVREDVKLRVPADLAAGSYPLAVGGHPIATIQVRAAHVPVDVPPIGHPLQARFANLVQLLGYDVSPAGNGVHVRLYWRALRETDTRYTVFVHALDDAGKILGQADVPPGTENWVRNQVATTTYDISLPSGHPARTLEIGLYDANSGKRLAVCTQENAGCSATADHLMLPVSV